MNNKKEGKNIEKTNIKSVVTIHDLIFMRYPQFFSAIDRKIYHKKFQSACNRADKIIAISQQTKNDIIEFFGTDENKIEVIVQLTRIFSNCQSSRAANSKICFPTSPTLINNMT